MDDQQEPSQPRPYMPAAQHPQQAPQQQGQQGQLGEHPFAQVLANMLPWGMADQLDLQRHLAGLTQVEQAHASNELSDEDAHSALGTIMPRLGQLLQKQQKAQQQQKQQGIQESMQQSALTESIRGLHLEHAANAFSRTLAHVIHPFTGKEEMYYPEMDAHGAISWKPVKYESNHQDDDRLVTMQAGTEGDTGETGIAGASGAEDAGGIQPADFQKPGIAGADLQQMKQQSAQSDQPLNYQQVGHVMRAASRDPADFEQTIHSGQHTDQYRGGKLISTTRKPAASTGDAAVTEEQLKGMHEMARRAVGPLRQDAGPHERIAYDTQVHALVQSMLGRQQIAHEYRLRATERQDQVRLQRQLDSEEHQRQEGARSKEAARKEQQRLEDHAIGKQRHEQSEARKEYTGALEGIQKRHAAWTKDPLNEGKELPDELKPENHDYHATRAAQRAIQRGRELSGSPDRPPGGKGGGTPAPGGDRGAPSAQRQGYQDDARAIISTASAPAAGKPADHEQVRRLLPVAQKALRDAKAVQWKGAPLENLQALHDILDRAHQEGRPLTGAETRQYSVHHQELDTTLKNHQVANGAEWLKLDAKPPVKPAETKATAAEAGPDRSKISKANQEHVRWLEWAARTSSSGEARRKIDRAADSVKRAVQYQKMDQDRDLPAYEEGLKLAEAQHERNAAEAVRTRSRLAFDDKSRYQKYQGE